MPVLLIFINFGAVPEALSGEQLYVQCSVGSQKASTDTTREHPPVWFTELCFDDANQTDAVLIELKQKGFLWDSVIASVSAPLEFVPYSSQHGDGAWVQMVNKGDTEPSDKHRLFMDLRFETPDGESVLFREGVPQPSSPLVPVSPPISQGPSVPSPDEQIVDPIPSVAGTDHNYTVKVTSPSLHSQEVEEREVQGLTDPPRPVPRPRKGLHHQGNIDSSMDIKEKEKEEVEEEEEVEGTEVIPATQDSSSQSLSSRARVQSLESCNSMADAEGPGDSPLPCLQRGSVLKSRIRPSFAQSSDRSSVGKLSADHSSIISEDQSKSDSSSTDNMPAPELTRALQHSPQKDEADNGPGMAGPLQISTSIMNQFGSQQCFDIRADHIVTPSRRFTMKKKKVRMAILKALIHHGIKDDLVRKAYCKAVQALINPPSTDEDQHSFEVWSAHKPTYCAECGSLLWGVARQGCKCRKCGLKCHERCATLVNADCSLYAAKQQELKRARTDKVDDKFVVSHVMSRLEKQITQDHKDQLKLLGECFGVSPEEHDQLLERAKQEVLQQMTNFKAVIKVRVISAEKLATCEDSNSIYVSVSVGGQRKRTKTFRKHHHNPVWNEEFTFDCNNAMDRIKVRVWNESSDNAMAKISQKLTKESDQFLGEKVIEVQSLGETTDLRHKLEKRTQESVVSGKVRLAVSAKDDKGYMLTPYHELYTYVHSHYSLPQALEIMCVLLTEIMFEVLDRDKQPLVNSQQEEAEEPNSRRRKHGRLASILQQLLNSLRIDLQSYREVFPADEPDKLEEFKYAIQLVQLIVKCQHEALDECLINPSRLVEDSMRQCGKAKFEDFMQECLATTAEKYPAGSDRTSNPKDFFLGLMQHLVTAILEDRNCYEKHVASFCKFSLGDLTAHELWYILCERLGEMLDKQMEDDTFPATNYINLLLAMNQMYKDYILKKGEPVPKDVEFPTLFEFYVLKWVKSYQEVAMSITTKAVAIDKNGRFAALDTGQHLSSSVCDIFWGLDEGHKILDKLSCNNVKQHHIYCRVFAEMIDHVLKHYVALIVECVEEFSDNLSVSLMLLNNLHHSRVNLQQLYESMGSSIDAGEGCSKILSDLQVLLAHELTTQCGKVARSLYGVILHGVRVVKTEVTRVKGVVKTQVTTKDVTPIVSDLMNTLASRGSMMVKECEESVLKKLVKELWQVTIKAFLDCFLPASRPAGRSQGSSAAAAVGLNFSQKQCLYLEQVLIVVKEFFLSQKEVQLKPKALDQSLAPLRKILSIYQQTTSSLIGQFVQQETEQDVGYQTARDLGKISLQLETSIHPGSQELEITVHVMSLIGLKPLTSGGTIQKPFVEICVVGPNVHGITRRHRTGTAQATGQNFVFAHEVKRMTIPHTVKFEELELQVMVKTQGFFASSHGNLLGLTVLQLRNHLEQSFSQQLDLVGRLKISPAGEAIISVLLQRGTDELAKEFVSLKQEERKGMQATAGN